MLYENSDPLQRSDGPVRTPEYKDVVLVGSNMFGPFKQRMRSLRACQERTHWRTPLRVLGREDILRWEGLK